MKTSNNKIINPTSVYNKPWVYVKHPFWIDRMEYSKIGKWLIFTDNESIDKLWKKIAKSTLKGDLGIASKASTNFPSKYGNKKVICVYTYDFEDKEDVIRVRNFLKTLGFVEQIPYKTDQATKAGIYGSKNEFLYVI